MDRVSEFLRNHRVYTSHGSTRGGVSTRTGRDGSGARRRFGAVIRRPRIAGQHARHARSRAASDGSAYPVMPLFRTARQRFALASDLPARPSHWSNALITRKHAFDRTCEARRARAARRARRVVCVERGQHTASSRRDPGTSPAPTIAASSAAPGTPAGKLDAHVVAASPDEQRLRLGQAQATNKV